jgi:hypothetical protein
VGRVVRANDGCYRAPPTHGALEVSGHRLRKLPSATRHVPHDIGGRERQGRCGGHPSSLVTC